MADRASPKHRPHVRPDTPLVVIALFGIVGLLLSSHLSLNEDSDGLLTTIMSLQKVTVYFWGEDRLGNLLPALTMWIHDPTGNAYAQIALRLVFGVLAPIFFCSLAFPRAIDSWRATLATQLLLVLGIKPTLAWETYVEAYPYGTSLACAGFATLALRAAWTMRHRARWILYIFGVAILVAAYVTDFGLVLFAVPIIGLLGLVLRSVFLQRLLIVHLLVAAVGFILPKVVFFGTTTPLGLAFIWPNELHFLRSITANMGWPFVCSMVLPVLLALGLAKWRRFRHGRRMLVVTLAAMLTVVLVCFVVVASSHWVAMNNFLPRYFIPGYVLLVSMGGVSLLYCCKYGINNHAQSSTTFICIALVLLLAGAARLTGWPRETQGIIGNGKGPEAWAVAGQSLGQHIDAIAGDYWDAWPAVFATEQYRYDVRADSADVLGITGRGEDRRGAFAARLAAQKELRVGCIDLKTADCTQLSIIVTGIPDLRGQEFAPAERLPDHQRTAFC